MNALSASGLSVELLLQAVGVTKKPKQGSLQLLFTHELQLHKPFYAFFGGRIIKGYKQTPVILQISAKPVTWGTFNLEYFFVYKFESTFLRNCVFCAGS